jgi:hypothetical protein
MRECDLDRDLSIDGQISAMPSWISESDCFILDLVGIDRVRQQSAGLLSGLADGRVSG